jgi:membrane-bound lytic murein transglycosylase A
MIPALTRRLTVLVGLSLLAACARVVPPPSQPPPIVRPSPVPAPTPTPSPPSAVLLGVSRAAPLTPAHFGTKAAAGLASFRESCPRLLVRTDASGLTRNDDWRPACASAATWPVSDAAGFFTAYFEPARVGDGAAFVTGYFEPEIAGSRRPGPGFTVPVYRMPTDLVRAWPSETPPEQRTGRPPLGRWDETGRFVPYHDRAAIDDGALAGRGLEIAWAADPVEFFFLQIQGSGRLRAPDGSVMRIGYAGQNGREYVALGKLMRERGLIGEGPGQYPGSMQGIMRYLRENPVEGRAMMRRNLSWIFFRELTGDGPLGALEIPVRPQVSVAADPRYVPLGAPVFLFRADRPEVNGLWIAQDTGGAIKGANRFDSFWGTGEAARSTAGGMAAKGQAVLLLPKGTLDRLGVR